MDAVEATTKIIEAYLSQPTANVVRVPDLLKKGAPDIAEAFKIIYKAVWETLTTTR